MKALGVGVLLIAVLAISALLDGETGLRIWRELKADLETSQARVSVLAGENEALQQEIETLEAEPAAVDRAIREELDLALPGEIVVRFGDSGGGLSSGSPRAEPARQETR